MPLKLDRLHRMVSLNNLFIIRIVLQGTRKFAQDYICWNATWLLKGQFTQNWKFCHHLLMLKLFQISKRIWVIKQFMGPWGP